MLPRSTAAVAEIVKSENRFRHPCVITSFREPVECDFCFGPLAGTFWQGVKCTLCNKKFHKHCLALKGNVCTRLIEEASNVSPGESTQLIAAACKSFSQRPTKSELDKPQSQFSPATDLSEGFLSTGEASPETEKNGALYVNINGVARPMIVGPQDIATAQQFERDAQSSGDLNTARPLVEPQESALLHGSSAKSLNVVPGNEKSTLQSPARADGDVIKFLYDFVQDLPLADSDSEDDSSSPPLTPTPVTEAKPTLASTLTSATQQNAPSLTETSTSPLEEAMARLSMNDPVLETAPFFHPLPPTLSQQERREYATKMLKDCANGSWLLRSSHGNYILVIKFNDHIINVKIGKAQGKYWVVSNDLFDSIPELLAHYSTSQLANDVPIPLGQPVLYNA